MPIGWKTRPRSRSAATGTTYDAAGADFAPLVPRPGKVVCVGLNYRNHILEMGRDLPEHPTQVGRRWGAESCYWTESTAFWYDRGNPCGCPHCTGARWRRAERRADRHEAARVCRDATAVHRAGGAEAMEDFDAYIAPQPIYW